MHANMKNKDDVRWSSWRCMTSMPAPSSPEVLQTSREYYVALASPYSIMLWDDIITQLEVIRENDTVESTLVYASRGHSIHPAQILIDSVGYIEASAHEKLIKSSEGTKIPG